MSDLKAGAGKRLITPRVGSKLVGYSRRSGDAKGVHDDLHARAIVLDNGYITIAICSVELLWLWGNIVHEIRQIVSRRTGIPEDHILICCTHTHSAAAAHDPDAWDAPLVDLIADAIIEAHKVRQPARVGSGFGQLFGFNLNRRWLNRPADPSIAVMRVDTADGIPLALMSNFACHAVVLGYDNDWISGDWPGYSSRLLEAELGHGCGALFTQGGAGDVNPLTETVRQRLAAGNPVGTIGELTSYYGQYHKDDPTTWNIEDRGGGTFIECETLARAYNAEVLRVYRTISTGPTAPLWLERVTVNGSVGPDEPKPEGLSPEYADYIPEVKEDYIPVEIMMIGIGSAVLMTQPGEVFSETAVEFRKTGQQMGYDFPWLISYANGSYAYLPPANAFAEGGYEVQWARQYGLSRFLQDRIREATLPVLKRHVP